MAKDLLKELANKLEENLDKQEEYLVPLKELKDDEDKLRTEMVVQMLKKGYKFVRTDSGLGFGITDGRKTFAIKKGSEAIAVKWALQEYPAILSISTAKLAQVLKPMLDELPPFVEEKTGDPFLTIRQQEAE